ncbi:hypothetical protein SAMN05446635_6222 [Burkholderia sp. OK233]|nr:hypothetical protein SAMN05446635_6222 [Burkholderia sp. OK233]
MTRMWPRPFAGTNAVAFVAVFIAGLALVLSDSARASTEEPAPTDPPAAAR